MRALLAKEALVSSKLYHPFPLRMNAMGELFCGILLSLICRSALGQLSTQKPPTIIFPQDLDQPENLIKIFDFSSKIILKCSARNAESVYFTYKKKLSDLDSNGSLPEGTKQEAVDYNTGTAVATRNISIRSQENPPATANGYYTCFANNNYGYTVQTPPMRLIVPVFNGSAKVFPMLARTTEPLIMPCISNETTFFPADLLIWNRHGVQWSRRKGPKRNFVALTERVRINPVTGNLHFAYTKIEDNPTQDEYYECVALIQGRLASQSVGRVELEVLESADEELDPVSVQYPLEGHGRVTCIVGVECILVCLYQGNVDNEPDLQWTAPVGSTTEFEEKDASISFITDASSEGLWLCGRGEWDQAQIEVTVLSYPKPTIRSDIGTLNSNVEFRCEHSNDQHVNFYFDTQPVPRVSSGGRMLIEQVSLTSDSLTISNIQQNDSDKIIWCDAVGSNDLFGRAAAKLIVRAATDITVKKTGEMELECTANVIDGVDIYWKTNQYDLNEEKFDESNPIVGIKVNRVSVLSTGLLKSTIMFNVGDDRDKWEGSEWWCVVDTTVETAERREISSSVIPFPFLVEEEKSNTSLIIGISVGAGVLVIVLIIIILVKKCHQKPTKTVVAKISPHVSTNQKPGKG